MDFFEPSLTGLFPGKPVWIWLAVFGSVTWLLILDLGVRHQAHREIPAGESLLPSAVYTGLGLGFGAWLWWHLGNLAGMETPTGFAVEQAP